MSWILTSQGIEFNVERPRYGQVLVMDIAWALSQINRFTGHCLRPYSVAEHSLLVCDIAEREFGLDVFGQLAALMHDAHEAYCGDLHTPGKHVVGAGWAEFERRLQYNVNGAFALHSAVAVHCAQIKQADLIALATERRDLLPPCATPWQSLNGIEPVGWLRLDSPERHAMNWEDWRDRWLDRYHELDFARNERLFPQPDAAQ